MSTDMIVEEQPQAFVSQVGNAQTTSAGAIALASAVLDKRITTARQFPRSVARFKLEAKQLLQQDVETAQSAEYAKPVGGGKVRGPSVRLAEIACLCWGNIEVEISEPIVSATSVTVQAFAWDLEKNIRVPGIASASILKQDGSRYPAHMVETTVNATASKARRNAILAAIPRAYINDLLDAAREVARKNQKPLEQVRVDMLEFFARTYRVENKQVFEYLHVNGLDDINLDHIGELRAVVAAIKEGEAVEVYFGKAKSKADVVKDRIAARKQKEGGDAPESADSKQASSEQDK